MSYHGAVHPLALAEHLAGDIRTPLLNVLTAGEYSHPGSLANYGQNVLHSFDPRTQAGALNWAAMLSGSFRGGSSTPLGVGEVRPAVATGPGAVDPALAARGWALAKGLPSRTAQGWAMARGTPVRPTAAVQPAVVPQVVQGMLPGSYLRNTSIADVLRNWSAGRATPGEIQGGLPGSGYRGSISR